MLGTASHQALNPPKDNSFQIFCDQLHSCPVKAGGDAFEIWWRREDDLEGTEMGGWWEKSWGWIILVELNQPLVRASSLLEH